MILIYYIGEVIKKLLSYGNHLQNWRDVLFHFTLSLYLSSRLARKDRRRYT